MKDDIQISKRLNNKVDKFIMNLSSSLSEDKQTVKDFQDEMKANFTISLLELLKAEHSEDEAFNIAVARFGDVHQLQRDLTGVFSVRNKVSRSAFIVAIISLLLALVCFGAHKKISEYRYISVPNDLLSETKAKVNKGISMNEGTLDKLLEKYKNRFEFIALYKRENNTKVLKNIYPSNFDMDRFREVTEVEQNYLTIYCNTPEEEQYDVVIGFQPIYIPFDEISVGIGLLITYWISFGIWATTKTHYSNRFNLGWGILFFIFNILGYGLFVLDDKCKSLQTGLNTINS
ncbi:permease prefix domain 1-containing protein [Clostridium manihotivorum]|uniref:Uncharacterized protein n=1 Tax=Clostridium manihotivorum TaxID=2320868 RepID=A0A3R5U7S3_9CLOT|nr:permease prefix domain 1-containing protein [Clostridium manihotivorum]QAA34075.1 hypothetical protein C1I91_21965 [Clostridium manihotivorum]